MKALLTVDSELHEIERLCAEGALGAPRSEETALLRARPLADVWHTVENVPREGMTLAVFSAAAVTWYVRFAEEGAIWLGISQEGSPRELLERIRQWLDENHPARVDRHTSLRVGVLLGEAFRRASGFRWGYVRVDGTPMPALLSAEQTHAVAPVDCLRQALHVGEKDLRHMFDHLEARRLPPPADESLTLLW